MALLVYQEPPRFNQVRQTIPFVVYSDLFATLGFDAIERSFKYLFEVRTMKTDGKYRLYSTVAIPPRPDNLTGFFDASAIIKSAVTQDLGTHLATGATPCPDSIVQFRVFCTERYLTTGGTYTSGTKILVGDYYATNTAVNENILQYLMNGVGGVVKPLHHHFLPKTDLKLYKNEPMTLSWLAQTNFGANLLEETHGDYGSFDKLVSLGDAYSTNMETVTGVSFASTSFFSLSGKSFVIGTTPGFLTTGTTSNTHWRFNNVPVDAGKTYTYEIWVRSNLGSIAFDSNKRVGVGVTGTGVTETANVFTTFWNSNTSFTKISTTFTTSVATNVQLFFRIFLFGAPSGTNNLTQFNGKAAFFDSAKFFEVVTTGATIGGGDIVVDEGLPTAITHAIPAGYFSNIIPANSYSDSRFDTPIGMYTNVLANNTKQDTLTGFYKNSLTQFGKYFKVNIKSNTGAVIGSSELIYQDTDDCSRYEKLRVKWLNDLGGWDYFTFNMVSSASTKVDRDQYKITNGKFNLSSGGVYKYTEDDKERGYKTLNLKTIDTFTMSSDWIIPQTAKFLQGLFTSPEVYLLNPEKFEKFVTDDTFDIEYPIFLQDTDIEYTTNSPDKKLVNITIKVSPANNFNEQTTNL
jgi:hypothetical protein